MKKWKRFCLNCERLQKKSRQNQDKGIAQPCML